MTDTFCAAGINGQLELRDGMLCIRRAGIAGFLFHGFKGDKEIQVASITSVQFRSANLFSNGYLQVTFSGGAEAKGGILQAASDENSVLFKRAQQPKFDALRDELRLRMGAARH